MPKVIKFNASALSKTRGKGNMRIGANSHDYGTSYYSMIEPPDGGYTIYENKASGGPSIRVANNEAELINLTRESSGTTYASAAECLAWFATQTDKAIVSSNDVFPNIITDGLVLELNASNLASYPGSGTTWYDLISGAIFTPDNNTPTYVNGTLKYWDFEESSNPGDNFKSTNAPSTYTQTQYTRIAVFNPESLDGYFRNIYCNSVGNNADMSLCIEASKLSFHQYTTTNDYTVRGNTTLTTGKWYFGAIVVDRVNNNLKIYLNGVLDRDTSINSIGNSTSNHQLIGGPDNDSYSGDRMFDGKIANIYHYNRLLSASEIKQNYYGAVVPDNPKIVLNNKKILSFENNQWSQNMTGLYSNTNLPNGHISHNDLNGDFDGLTEFTYCLWLKVHNVPVGYSHSAFNKYAGTSTAVVRLYQFGTTSGASNLFKFYVNGGGSWGDIGGGYYGTNGETFFMVIQYNSTDRGQLWINGQKVGSRAGRSGTIATNSSNFYIYPDNGSNTNSTVKEAYVYNHELTDQEIITLFNSTRGNHGI